MLILTAITVPAVFIAVPFIVGACHMLAALDDEEYKSL